MFRTKNHIATQPLITDEFEEEFAAEGITLTEGAIVYVNYAEWNHTNPEGMYFGVDRDGDGNVDD